MCNEISLLDILGTEANYVLDEVELKVQVGKLYEQLNKILTPRKRNCPVKIWVNSLWL